MQFLHCGSSGVPLQLEPRQGAVGGLDLRGQDAAAALQIRDAPQQDGLLRGFGSACIGLVLLQLGKQRFAARRQRVPQLGNLRRVCLHLPDQRAGVVVGQERFDPALRSAKVGLRHFKPGIDAGKYRWRYRLVDAIDVPGELFGPQVAQRDGELRRVGRRGDAYEFAAAAEIGHQFATHPRQQTRGGRFGQRVVEPFAHGFCDAALADQAEEGHDG